MTAKARAGAHGSTGIGSASERRQTTILIATGAGALTQDAHEHPPEAGRAQCSDVAYVDTGQAPHSAAVRR
jgi:hypothetical protein